MKKKRLSGGCWVVILGAGALGLSGLCFALWVGSYLYDTRELPSRPAIADATGVPSGGVIIDVAYNSNDLVAAVPAGTYLVDATTGEFTRWVQGFPRDSVRGKTGVSVAPGTAQLFFHGVDGDPNAVFAVDLTGTRTRIGTPGENESAPSVSADGRHLAWRGYRRPSPSAPGVPYVRFERIGSGPRGSELAIDANTAALSPQGDWLAYASTDDAHPRQVHRVRIDGSEDAVVFDGYREVVRLEWSPDGKRIAAGVTVMDGPYGAQQLWLADADGAHRTRVTVPVPKPHRIDVWLEAKIGQRLPSGEITSFTWSPDGSRMALLVNRDGPCWNGGQDIPGGCYLSLFLVDADGTRPTALSTRCQTGGQIYWVR